jgi:cyclophilin family peptidyl-prolyl cis-trans isomerase
MRKLVVLGVVGFLLAGCGGGGKSAATTAATTTTAALKREANGCITAPKPTTSLDPSKTYLLTMKTNLGSFTIRLDPKQSPHATASLVALARAGYFDSTKFHRIVPGFVIQGGDPSGTGTCGPGYSTVDTPPAGARYTHGVVAMAKTAAEAPGTAGSQFFVVTGADAGLPPDYAIVGKVVKGIAVVDHIGTLGNAAQQPTRKVVITKATVTQS